MWSTRYHANGPLHAESSRRGEVRWIFGLPSSNQDDDIKSKARLPSKGSEISLLNQRPPSKPGRQEKRVQYFSGRKCSFAEPWNVNIVVLSRASPSPRMQWQRAFVTGTLRPATVLCKRVFTSTAQHVIKPVRALPSWDVTTFRKLAFDPALPARLSSARDTLPPACQKWFLHDGSPDLASDHHHITSELNYPFWHQHQDTTVPIELTRASSDGTKTFHRSEGPLKLFLDHSTSLKSALADNASRPTLLSPPSLYIAQCALNDLPRSLQEDLPTPELVLQAGKGEIYDSSLWMGRPPTFTPLHKDPNPNLFVQLAGQKLVRLFNPEVGRAVFDAVQVSLGGRGNAAVRGEEMMQGREREELEDAVWGDENIDWKGWQKEGFEARLSTGDGLFIPKGWWHSVRGVGAGINASVNWWFR